MRSGIFGVDAVEQSLHGFFFSLCSLPWRVDNDNRASVMFVHRFIERVAQNLFEEFCVSMKNKDNRTRSDTHSI